MVVGGEIKIKSDYEKSTARAVFEANNSPVIAPSECGETENNVFLIICLVVCPFEAKTF